MKKCPWCGKEYGDNLSACPTDNNPLDSLEPIDALPIDGDASAAIANEAVTQILHRPEFPTDPQAPEGYYLAARYEPFEASRFLDKFTKAGVRFLIDRVERQLKTLRYRKSSWIEIYVHKDDEQKATEILNADIKL
jgi:hypothetical protein